jgi:hypothetical protein
MSEVYLLEWTFTPADYFEESVDFTCDLCSIHVENGKAEAHVPPAQYPADHSAQVVEDRNRKLGLRFVTTCPIEQAELGKP